jgi:hypothetical protein
MRHDSLTGRFSDAANGAVLPDAAPTVVLERQTRVAAR